MISRFPVRMLSAALLPGLIVSCQKAQSPSADLLQQAADTAASSEVLLQENKENREKIDTLTVSVQELEALVSVQKESREEIANRLKELEDAKLSAQTNTEAPAPEEIPAPIPEPAPAPASVTPPKETPEATAKSILASTTNKILVIEGDQERGTGFLCTTEGSLWLYAAAHVISGNKSFTVRDTQNTLYQTADSFEIAEGVDLIRIKILNSDAQGLELQSPDQSPENGDPISAIGNGGGKGIVVAESGQILGKGADSWEVSTKITPENSGGPVITVKDQKVIGLVTYTILGKKEVWATDTRFAEVRHFAARLDKTYKWTTITPARFLKEYQIIAQIDDETRLAYAAMLVYMGRSVVPREDIGITPGLPVTPEQRAKMSEYMANISKLQGQAQELLDKNPTHPFTLAVKAAKDRGGLKSDENKRSEFSQILRSKLDLGSNTIKPEAFTWYHRESYKQSLIWRSKIVAQLGK